MNNITAKNAATHLKQLANTAVAAQTKKFFKTGKGEYAAGDIFIGVYVPEIKKLAKMCIEMSLEEIGKLIKTKTHEERMLAIQILVMQFKKADKSHQYKIYQFYLSNTKFINNWDLVDASASYIVGNYLQNKDKKILYRLAKSSSMWERRIAVVATHYFIKNDTYEPTLAIAELLLGDEHDLIHKATGWMLRELGKRNMATEVKFLRKYAAIMPRTMLRYAIERFPESQRREYLHM